MTIWERIQQSIENENTTQEWVAKKIDEPTRTFRGWLNRKIMPNADQCLKIARALRTTVEELVDGEDGKAYLREIVGTSPVRENLRDLVRDIETLSDQDIEELRALVSIKVNARRTVNKHA